MDSPPLSPCKFAIFAEQKGNFYEIFNLSSQHYYLEHHDGYIFASHALGNWPEWTPLGTFDVCFDGAHCRIYSLSHLLIEQQGKK